ncbi:MAG: 50S ribosomal protein L2 [Planctomycetota bacterium]|nr:50S ribosomal protein L2 [Planctomycetota bacterium]
MPIRIYKPTSAGRRNASVNAHVEVTKSKPEKSLLLPKPKTGGRNHDGVIRSRGRGGGVKQMYRMIDFRRRDRHAIEANVAAVEHDPNRSCHIALLKYTDGVKRYVLAPGGIRVGMKVVSSNDAAVEPNIGNRMCLRFIPTGLDVHDVEIIKGKGGQMCRSAGSYAKLTNKEGDYATLTLPSGELRRVPIDCMATVGQVGNGDHRLRRLGKAGLTRLMGRRPITRGIAKSHHAHPLGGGSGRSKGNRPPCGPTGVLAKGGRTRNRKKPSSKLIVRRRVSKRYGQLK